jgi:hypothetical protein
MLKVKLYFFSLFLIYFFWVEVVRFFVTYGLARNKNRLCKIWEFTILLKFTKIYNITKRKLVLIFLFNAFIVK